MSKYHLKINDLVDPSPVDVGFVVFWLKTMCRLCRRSFCTLNRRSSMLTTAQEGHAFDISHCHLPVKKNTPHSVLHLGNTTKKQTCSQAGALD